MPPPPPPGPPGMAGCDSGYDMHHSRYLNGTVYDTIALPNATGDPDHLLSKCCAKCTADGKKCDGWQSGEICDDPNPPSGAEITLFPCAVSSDSRSFAKTGSGQTQGKLWNEISRRRFSQVRLSAARSSISCVLVSTASSRPSALTAVSASNPFLPLANTTAASLPRQALQGLGQESETHCQLLLASRAGKSRCKCPSGGGGGGGGGDKCKTPTHCKLITHGTLVNQPGKTTRLFCAC